MTKKERNKKDKEKIRERKVNVISYGEIKIEENIKIIVKVSFKKFSIYQKAKLRRDDLNKHYKSI